MISDKKNKKVSSRNSQESWHALKDFLGFVCLSFAVFMLISLISYDPTDPSFNTKVTGHDYSIQNYCGVFGSYVADLMMQLFGYASYLFPIGMIEVVRSLVFKKNWTANFFKFTGFVLLMIFTTLGLSLANGHTEMLPLWGGFCGYYAKQVSVRYFGLTGTVLLWASFGLTSVSMVFGWGVKDFMIAFHQLSVWLGELSKKFAIAGKDKIAEAYETAQEAMKREEKEIEKGLKEIKATPENVIPIKAAPSKPKISIDEKLNEIKEAKAAKEEAKKAEKKLDVAGLPPIVIPTKPVAAAANNLPDRNQAVVENTKEKTNYKLPTVELLSAPENQELEINRDELLENASILEQKLRDFGVDGKVVEVQPGPVVTMYEFEPASGVKVNQITRLNDDLTLALRAMSVRISLVPGKSVIGIEVANRNRQVVYLKDIISNSIFEQNPSKLTFAFGKDISGNPYVSDLRKMPHVLVAGATGSGKSVAINSMILSVLYKSTPEEVRMILVDPKMLELSMYDGIPHLLLPVVTDPRKAAAALRWATQEMERRYRLMASLGVRNLEGYNAKVLKHMEDNPPPAQESLPIDGPKIEKHDGKLPFLMIVIDELADLMMVSSREVEDSIIRLAQMARASGIHLVLATQRPSVDVITGVIKANMPSRISFQVSSKIDSRTILDTNGAETLLGAGDMLFMPPGTSRILRCHGAFVTDQEVEKVTNFWKEQGDPDYHEEILATPDPEDSDDIGGSVSGEEDELYRQSLEIVRERGIASISYIQRRLRIGYNRAARLVERMEEEGLLAPGEVGKPREVIAHKFPMG